MLVHQRVVQPAPHQPRQVKNTFLTLSPRAKPIRSVRTADGPLAIWCGVLWRVAKSCTTNRMVETCWNPWKNGINHLSNKWYIPWILLKITIFVYQYVIIYNIYIYIYYIILRYANDYQEKSFEQVNSFRISSIHCMWCLSRGCIWVTLSIYI